MIRVLESGSILVSILVTWGDSLLRISIKRALFWVGGLALVAFGRVHFRSVTTAVAYNLGQLKTTEGRLLEERSALQGDLARLTTKKNLEQLSESPASLPSEQKGPSRK
jgi:hypothetical protein